METSQISAHISKETKSQLDSYVTRHGVKKGFLVEEALLHHLQALREIPEDLVIPSKVILSKDSFEKVLEQIDSKEPPTSELVELMNQQ